MSVEQVYSAAKYVACIQNLIAQRGMSLTIGTEFEEFSKVSSLQPQKGHVAPIFDPAYSDISAENGFWMIGRDADGEIVHTQAIRVVDLSGTNLGDHLKHQLGDYRPHGDSVDPSRSKCYLTHEAAQITGKVCYYGELWLKGGPGGFRGGSITALLPRLMFATSMLHWQPDYIIGIMEPLAAFKGLSAREGYTHLEQGSIFWNRPREATELEEWFVWMTAEDLSFNMRVQPETLNRLYETPRSFEPVQQFDKAA